MTDARRYDPQMSKRRKPAQPNLPTTEPTEPAEPAELDEQDADGLNDEQDANGLDDVPNLPDASPLVIMAGALADLDLSLENLCANAPPFLGLPSGQTMSDFLGALLAGDDATANKALQRHCDGAFYSALKELQRRESATKSDEDATTRATRLASGARVAVASGALVYARFFTALAVTIHTAELHTSVEAGEHGDRAKA